MTTVKLSSRNDTYNIAKFDGEVLEFFSLTQSRRIHISYVQTVTLETDRQGYITLIVSDRDSKHSVIVDSAQIPKVTALAADIQRAIGTFKFD